jgi:hypothetical protein
MEQPLRQSSGVNLSDRFRQLVQRAQDLTEATLRHEFVQSLHEFVLQATGYDPLPQLEEQIALPAEFGGVLLVVPMQGWVASSAKLKRQNIRWTMQSLNVIHTLTAIANKASSLAASLATELSWL